MCLGVRAFERACERACVRASVGVCAARALADVAQGGSGPAAFACISDRSGRAGPGRADRTICTLALYCAALNCAALRCALLRVNILA